jgi:subtilisin-like proprotein convertase family protein
VQFKSLFLSIAAVFAIVSATGAQAGVITISSANVPVEICDTCTVSSTLSVGSHGRIIDVDALVDITHGWDADLVLSLSHGGVSVLLSNRQGGSGGANYTGTVFDDGAAISIAEGYAYAPYTGAFRPEEALAAFIGHDVFGDWILTVIDSEAGDAGSIDAWGLRAEVPEPASLGLFGVAALGLGAARRRKPS